MIGNMQKKNAETQTSWNEFLNVFGFDKKNCSVKLLNILPAQNQSK
jgi:hypothetical protein